MSRRKGRDPATPLLDPPLPAALMPAFERWVAEARRRHAALSFRELRRGVQSISSLYVERRSERSGARAQEGPAKRAAFATYYAPLHFLTAYHAARASWPAAAPPARILDLGAGTGAAGAAAALASGAGQVLAVERSGWALGEARHTAAAFGLALRTRRATLPAGLPRWRPGDAIVCGWLANECAAPLLDALGRWLGEAARAGARILLLDPLAKASAAGSAALAAQLAGAGVRALEFKVGIARPAWLEELDRAAGLDHRELGARLLVAGGAPA